MNLPKNDTKEAFRKCGTCSQTFAFLINREYEHHDPIHEKALDTLAGGIFREGHQCGMLWGAALATGAEAYKRSNTLKEAKAMALVASHELLEAFQNRANSIECREITGVQMNRLGGLLKFMLETLAVGMNNSKCFVLAEDWTPDAIEASQRGLREADVENAPSHNCASIVAESLGATEEESVMVAGFAGGFGLSGKGCGALATAVWMKTLKWLRENPGKTPPMFRFKEVSELVEGFKKETNELVRCEEICGRRFDSAEDHSDFIKNGGCKKLLEWFIQN